MDDRERIRSLIQEIAGRRKNVTFEEIEWVVTHLTPYHSVAKKEGRHGVLFRIDGQRFGVCKHHSGSRQIKSCYVDDFLSAMIELGWYLEDEDASEGP
jgi:hypothetical protein